MKLHKPPSRQDNEPEIIDYKCYTWKWCDKCFNGTWNRTHVTTEHVAGVGKCNKNCKLPAGADNASVPPQPKANLAETIPEASAGEPTSPQANIAASSSTLDFCKTMDYCYVPPQSTILQHNPTFLHIVHQYIHSSSFYSS